jgi:hypothetical protein
MAILVEPSPFRPEVKTLFINATPHDVHYYVRDAEVAIFPKSGFVINAVSEPQTEGNLHISSWWQGILTDVHSIKISSFPRYGGVSGLDKLEEEVHTVDGIVMKEEPENWIKPYVGLIVSTISSEALKDNDRVWDSADIIMVPDTSSAYGVRDKDGKILGTTRFNVILPPGHRDSPIGSLEF